MTPPTDLVVDALRAEASRRLRAGLKLALELEQDRAGGKDVRSRAVRLVTWLAGGATLEAEADRLAGLDVRGVAGLTGTPISEPPAPLEAPVDPDDDGLSPEAHRAAQLAGLDPTVLEEDPETGSTAEDDVDAEPTPEELTVLAEVGK